MEEKNQNTDAPFSSGGQLPPSAPFGQDNSSNYQALGAEPQLSSQPFTSASAPEEPGLLARYGKLAGMVVVILLILGSIGLVLGTRSDDQTDDSAANRFDTTEIDLEPISSTAEGVDFGSQSVVINGSLQLNGEIIISPSVQPTDPVAGQLYYDQTGNVLAYYNGVEFISLTGSTVTQTTTGGGGVTSLQGQTGAVTLDAGNGIAITGTTIALSGTVAGNLNVGGGLTLGTPLPVGSGGTGTTTLTLNGVLIGQGTGAVTAVTGAPGECLLATAGAPAFAACPGGGGGVSSIDGQTGIVDLANATGAAGVVTINDASTAQKGIAQFNATNFSAAAGVINTIQNINTGASPQFTGLTLTGNAVVQGGTVTIGTTSQAASLALHDGSSNTGTLQVAPLASDRVYTFPDATGTVCLTTGNCAGAGSGVTTPGGTTNRVPKFTAAQTIGDSTVSDDGTNVTTTIDLVIQGGDATLGVASSQTGSLNFKHASSANTGTITQGALTGNHTYTLPDATGAFCLTSGNCLGGGGGGANTALSNLASVAINTTLLPGAAGTIHLGSATLPFGDVFLAGTSGTPATNNFRITGASTSGTRTITLPDATGTVCLQTAAACGFATGTGAAFVQGGNSFGATAVLGTNDANGLNFEINNGVVATISTTGAATFTPNANGTSSFNIENTSGSNILTIDTTNSAVGINLGGNNTPGLDDGLEINGALRMSGAGQDSFTSPDGAVINVDFGVTVQSLGAFSQVAAMGIDSASDSRARVLSLFDDRAGVHQPTLAVFSPNENDMIGFTWNGSTSAGSVVTSDRISGTSMAIILQSGNVTGGAGSSGEVIVTSGSIAGGTGGSTGLVTIQSGNGAGTDSNTGNLIIDAGSKTGAGVAGTITIGGTNASALTLGRSGLATNNAGLLTLAELGTTNTAAYLCRNASNQLAACSGTGAGAAFVQGGNSFGATAVLGTNDSNSLTFETNNVTQATIAVGGAATFQNSANSTSAFRILNASPTSGELFGADSTNSILRLLNNNPGVLPSWTTNANDYASGRFEHGSATYNGYVYVVAGNDDADVPQSTVYYAKVNANGSIGTWASTTALPQVREELSVVATNGYLYAIGGRNSGGTVQTTVYYAKINADGTVGTWNTTTTLPVEICQQSSVVANGFIYAIGGDTTGGTVATVYYAKVGSDGTLGAWGTTTALPAVRKMHASVVANGYVYAIAGHDGGTPYSSTLVAKLNTDGTVGSWAATTSLPSAYYNGAAGVLNGYVYHMGGQGADFADVYYAQLGSDGTLSSWTQTTDMNVTRRSLTALTANGYIYALGGENGSAIASQEYASSARVTVGGSLDLVSLSGENLAEGGSGGNLTAGNTHIAGLLTVTDNASLKGGAVVNNNLAVISNANSSAALSVINAAGGEVLGADTVDSILRLLANNTGHVQAFTADSDTITNREGAAYTTLNGYFYLFGGCNSVGASTTTVQHSKLNADGSLSAWSTTSAALPNASCNASATTYNGYVYVSGGTSSAATGDDIYVGRPGADGVISAWTTLSTALPDDLKDHAFFAYNGYLYAVGGQDTASSVVAHSNDASRAKINADGSVGAFTTQTDWIPANRMSFGNAVANGYFYIVGGKASNGGAGQATLYYGKLNADGSLGTASTASAPPFAYRSNLSTVANGYLYSLGGDTSGTKNDDVYSTPLGSDGNVGAWTLDSTAMPGNRDSGATATVNGYIYYIGGHDGTDEQNNAWYTSTTRVKVGGGLDLVGYSGENLAEGGSGGQLTAGNTHIAGLLTVTGNANFKDGAAVNNNLTVNAAINTTSAFSVINAAGSEVAGVDTVDSVIRLLSNNTGHLGAFATNANALNSARSGGHAVGVNGYLYLPGGFDSGNARTATVQYARANSDGSTGTWATTTALPVASGVGAATTYNGYVYVNGGNAAAADGRDIFYGRVNNDGTVPSWTTIDNFLASGQDREDHTMVAYNGFLYIIGGEATGDGADNRNISYGRINADGSLDTVATLTDWLPAAGLGLRATVANGYLYVLGESGDTIYYGKINNDGTIAAATTETDTLVGNRDYGVFGTMNGYLYAVAGGGSGNTTVYYSALNNDGSIGAWATDTTVLPAPRVGPGGVILNSYIYVLGGDSSGAEQSTVYYASGSRVKVGGGLDLVGYSGESMAEGGSGGQLTAGNTHIAGLLTVTGNVQFKDGLSVHNNLTIHAQNESTAILALLTETGVPLLTVDSTGADHIRIGTSDNNGVLLVLDTKTGSGDPSGVLGAMYYNSNSGKMRCFEVSEGSTGYWRDCIPSARTEFYAYSDLSGNAATDLAITTFSASGESFTPAAAVAGHPGIVNVSVDTVGSDAMVVANGDGTTVLLGGGDTWRYETALRIPTLSTGTQRFETRAGFVDSLDPADTTVDGCYFKHRDDINAGEWQGVCSDTGGGGGGTSTCDTNQAVVASTWYRLTVVVNSAGTSADFQINGTSRCTISANIADTTGLETSFLTGAWKTVGSTARTVGVDYVEVHGLLGTSR